MVLLPNFQRDSISIEMKKRREILFNKNFIESLTIMTPFDLALKNFEFYLNDLQLQSYFTEELVKAKNDGLIRDDEIIVCIYGFNQIERKSINTIMNFNIQGDILMLYIGPSRNFEIYPTSLDF